MNESNNLGDGIMKINTVKFKAVVLLNQLIDQLIQLFQKKRITLISKQKRIHYKEQFCIFVNKQDSKQTSIEEYKRNQA
ncbi:hypothetical protein TTHERM_01166290 (macronuclear) [Tetrahymena thermophila SB210]|uniref:Uncharacterized protein n=1 Tax=Tetrahymena thermophila (strain SB210) TaxID=312017 RepID=Q24FJ7_TETTS|nr:hypothetical protein TTHERM_01166290 [Tetrahymena thermophila SB210]EAS06553.1 hypothetical protein TTHERM_01166290 [Tetrahymena thermophila SB210]|eukprot:XP_001026798.1 hypothetical protein TTHERM_01166290 [Tetrahymena thermophila SB210]